jgi:hypothetical protein
MITRRVSEGGPKCRLAYASPCDAKGEKSAFTRSGLPGTIPPLLVAESRHGLDGTPSMGVANSDHTPLPGVPPGTSGATAQPMT